MTEPGCRQNNTETDAAPDSSATEAAGYLNCKKEIDSDSSELCCPARKLGAPTTEAFDNLGRHLDTSDHNNMFSNNIKQEHHLLVDKKGEEHDHNVLLKNTEGVLSTECEHNSNSNGSNSRMITLGRQTAYSASSQPVKMEDPNMKQNLHSTDVTPDLTNNNELKPTTYKASSEIGKTLPFSNVGHVNQNGFISIDKRNGHMESHPSNENNSPMNERVVATSMNVAKYDYEDDDHANLVIDEGVDTDLPSRMSSSADTKYRENSTTIQALTRDFSVSQVRDNSVPQYAGGISPLVNRNGFPFGTSTSKSSQKQGAVISPGKGADALKSSSGSAVKPRCAPVREAVDPAKYITVQEGDGVKYACSKCGNIYKWRKSLNKHWKEKHEGEIPEPRSGIPSLPIASGPAGFRPPTSRASYYSGVPQVSQRSLPTSPKEKPYTPSVSRSGGFPRNPFSPKPYGSTKTFGEVSAEKLYQTSTPKGLSPGISTTKKSLDSYLMDSSQRQHGGSKSSGSVMMQYLTKQSPIKLPQEKLSKSQIPHSPPLAHSNKPTPQYIPPRPTSKELPVDLTRDLMFQSSKLTDAEDVLDLSKKTSYNHTVAAELPQEEPLDFSKKTTTSSSSTPHVGLSGFKDHPVQKTEYQAKLANDVQDKVRYISPPPPIKIPEPSKIYTCNMCTYVTRHQSELELHQELHSTDSQYFLCAECHETCTSLESLNQHFSMKHLDCLAKQKADLQKESHSAASSDPQNSAGPQLYKYLTMESSRNTMSCRVCGIIYQWQWALSKHFEQDHSTLPNPYQNEQASEQVQPTSAPSPVVISQDYEQTVFQCHSCSFVASSKSDLTRHQIRHSLNKHHVCKVCGYTAKVPDELQEHYAKEHPSVNPKDLKSSTGTVILSANTEDSDGSVSEATQILGPDGKSLIDFSAENTAIVIPQAPEDSNNTSQANNRSKAGRKPNTGNSPSSVDILLPYKCTECEYRARWPSEITQHMKNHSDEKPFHCPRCTYKSKWKWDVVKHLKRCGGGTVKDVIDTTKLKKNQQVRNIFEVPESIAYTQGRELSNGPPNVTVVPEGSVERGSYYGQMGEEDGMDLCQHTRIPKILSSGEQSPSNCSDDGGIVYQCNMCTYVGHTDKELSHHMLIHLERSPHNCRGCNYTYKSRLDLKKHCTTHNHQYDSDCKEAVGMGSPQSDEPAEDSTGDESIEGDVIHYRCDLCPYSTSKKSFFQAHQTTHRGSEKSSFTCRQCGEESADLVTFLQHKRSHSEILNGGQQKSISELTHNNDSNVDLESDLKEHGGSSSRRKQPKKTIVKTLVLEDEADHQMTDEDHEVQSSDFEEFAPNNSNMYICQYCPYVTNNRANFERHMPHHEVVSKYRCECCNWSSDQLNLLYRHVQVVHPGYVLKQDKEAFYDNLKDYSSKQSYSSPCETSTVDSHYVDLKESKSFDRAGGMKRGNVFSEGKKTKRRLKTCVKCGYVTDNVTTLQRHMAKHGKNGKYTCKFCDYSVDKQHVLDYHIRLVHARELPNPATVMIGSLEPDNTSSSTVDFNDNVSNGNSSNGENMAEEESVNFEEADTSTVQGEDVKIVHVGTRTVYGCTKCPYHTMKISGVLNHSRQHGQKKKYTCIYCNYSVDQSAHVKNHMKTVHRHNAEFISHKEIETAVRSDLEEMDCNTDVTSNGNDSELPDECDEAEYEPQGKKQRVDEEVQKTSLSCVYKCSKCSHTSYSKVEWMKHKLIHMDDRMAVAQKPTLIKQITSTTTAAVDRSDTDSDARTEDERSHPSSPSSKALNGSIDINSNTAVPHHV